MIEQYNKRNTSNYKIMYSECLDGIGEFKGFEDHMWGILHMVQHSTKGFPTFTYDLSSI